MIKRSPESRAAAKAEARRERIQVAAMLLQGMFANNAFEELYQEDRYLERALHVTDELIKRVDDQ
jgi:hypothetical protein